MTLVTMGTVLVPTPGTPVQITSDSSLRAAQITVQALPSQTGNAYVGTAALNKTTFAGVARVLAAGNVFDVVAESGTDEIQLSQLYLDMDAAGQGALISYWVE